MKYLVLAAATVSLAACTQPYGDRYGDPYGYPPAPPTGGYYPQDAYDPYGSGYGDTQTMDPYRATGTEPFWSLTINPQSMRFEAMGGRTIVDDTPRVQAGYAGDVYRGRRIEVNIVHQRCSDGMSDRVYPDQVQVYVDGREWRGCGAPERYFQQGWESGTAPGYGGYGDDRDPYGYDRDPYAATSPLARTSWRVTRINGTAVSSGGYYMNFLPDRLQARFGCNDLSGGYSQQGERLSVDRLSSTRMACPDLAAETRASNVLSAPMRVRLSDDLLILSNDRGEIQARRSN